MTRLFSDFTPLPGQEPNRDYAISWTSMLRFAMEGNPSVSAAFRIQSPTSHAWRPYHHPEPAPAEIFQPYHAHAADYGDLLVHHDEEMASTSLGLTPGSPERRQCNLLATAAAIRWARRPAETPAYADVRELACSIRWELFRAAEIAQTAVGSLRSATKPNQASLRAFIHDCVTKHQDKDVHAFAFFPVFSL